MRRLVERGLLTAQEREVLVDAEVPATQRHNAVLLWITRVFVEAWQAGHFIGATGFENQILEKIHVCRAQYGAIGDELAGRMPLAYAHIVQVLVDVVLWFYPFMAIASQMSDGLVVLGTGLLTISYQGLFDLAKQFLDPYDNESYGKGEDPLLVDTLIAETNAGSVRWMNSLNEFPVSPQRIKDGELSDYLLPQRGYSVEELAQMEEDRKKREFELQQRREREEEERRIAEEKAARLRRAAEKMIPALLTKKSTFTMPSTFSLETVNGDARADQMLSSKAGTFSLNATEGVAHVISNMNAMAGGIPSSLLPRGIPAASQEDEMIVRQRRRQAKDEKQQNTNISDDSSIAREEELYGEIEDFHDDGAFQVIEDWSPDEEYVHKFDSFDSFKDLPWFDEVGPDGQEIRLSQLLADEVWEEEKEAALERERINTFEEYSKRVEEIREAADSELAETQEILSAVPNAEYSSLNPREGKDGNVYDQTKLDGISQLWGCPPGELSDMPSYKEPKISGETEFRGIAQLFGEPEIVQSREDDYYDQIGSDDESSFNSIGSLWGGGFDEDLDDDLSYGATRPIRESPKNYRPVPSQDEDDEVPRGTFQVSEGSEVRLSQMLADEIWDEEEDEELEKAVSFEEYAQQIADILEAEKEEQLETEAILNAPSFAEFVGTFEDDETASSIKASNTTLNDDDLSVFEMDVMDEESRTEPDIDTIEPETKLDDDDELPNDSKLSVTEDDEPTNGESPRANQARPEQKEGPDDNADSENRD